MSEAVRATLSKIIDRDGTYLALLGILFLIAFAVPIFFLFQVILPESSHGGPSEVSEDALFPEALSVNRSNNYIEVEPSVVLEPMAEKDFVFATWFRLKSLPEEGEDVVFVAKFDASHVTRRGYSFGLSRDSGQIVPIVSWRDGASEGGVHRFSPMEIVPKRWTLLVLSYLDGKFLGMHGGFRVSTRDTLPIVLLGGFQLDPPVLPRSDSPLFIGALQNGRFRGKLGPQMIFHGERLSERLPGLLNTLVEAADNPPQTDLAELVFWTNDGEENRGRAELVVSQHGLGGKKRKGAAEERGKQQ